MSKVKEIPLKACPETPNCVQSFDPDDAQHYRPAWRYEVDRAEAWGALRLVLKAEKNCQEWQEKGECLEAVFRMPVLGFRDDVSFWLLAGEKRIHYRSASRCGRSDLGVNQRRMKRIARKLSRYFSLT